MSKPDDEYGLLIDRANQHGTEYVTVHVVRRRAEDGDVPLGCSGDGEMYLGYGCPKHMLGLVVDGLGMYGFVSDSGDAAYIGYDVEFRNVYASAEHKLARMLKAIKRVNAQIDKDEAREPGDKFASFAKALKLSFAVTRIGERRRDPRVALHVGRGRPQHLPPDDRGRGRRSAGAEGGVMSLQNPKPSDSEPIHSVYWLHSPEHTDPFTQGYIGITHRKNRQKEHRDNRRFPAEHIFTVLASNLTRFEAAKMEWVHRKQKHIGWNTKAGGGKFIRALLGADSTKHERPGSLQPRINVAATEECDMKRLKTQSLLQFAAASVPVLKSLTELDQRMTYKQFGIVIGLVDQEWQPWHRHQIAKVLDTAVAANRLIGDTPLDHRRIVNQSTGVPGAGAERNIMIGAQSVALVPATSPTTGA